MLEGEDFGYAERDVGSVRKHPFSGQVVMEVSCGSELY